MKVAERETKKQDKQALLAKFKKLEEIKEKWKNKKRKNPYKERKKGDDKLEPLNRNGGGPVKNKTRRKSLTK